MHLLRFSLMLATAMVIGTGAPVQAQGLGSFFENLFGGNSTESGLRATIWVDPDGCEHWVMDDGLEGFMSSHLDKQGKPVCRSVPVADGVCKSLDSAALFAVGSSRINADVIAELTSYFETIAGRDVVVAGHTDNTGSEQANLALSLKRAAEVAKLARKAGVNAEARGFGDQVPIASNDSAEGRAQNRRVELICS